MKEYKTIVMGGTQIVINKKGGCDAIYTAEGVEIEGVICHTLEMTQTPSEKHIGIVRVKMEMFVYEQDLSSNGKFKPTDFIRNAKR
jgi:hypothetical protein